MNNIGIIIKCILLGIMLYLILDFALIIIFDNFSLDLNFFGIILFPILLLLEGLFRIFYPIFQYIKSIIKEIY